MRRFPIHALSACLGAVLLVGCEYPNAPVYPRPDPPAQSLSFEIAGPFRIDASGSFSWEAIVFGGSGAYQYQWEVKRLAGQLTTTSTAQQLSPSNERRLSLLVRGTDGDMLLRLTLTSGDQTRVRTFTVKNCIGAC